jgi:serine/threonine protein kinase
MIAGGLAALGGAYALYSLLSAKKNTVPSNLGLQRDQEYILNGNRFSGKDDEYNTIEGLRHGGLAQQKRKQLTDFGSGFDRIRQMAKTLGVSFDDLTKSKSFIDAMSSAKEVRQLGAGTFGKAHLMETEFGGESFQFVRKRLHDDLTHFHQGGFTLKEHGHLLDLEREASMMRPFGEGKVIPSVYRSSKQELMMEYMPGKSLREFAHEGKTLPIKARNVLDEAFQEVGSKGILNKDIHGDNILYDPKTKRVSWIDQGLARFERNVSPADLAAEMEAEASLSSIELRKIANKVAGGKALPISMSNVKSDIMSSDSMRSQALTVLPRTAKPLTALTRKPGARFSASREAFNTIAGLPEQGFAKTLRTKNTDFGSPWKGLFGGISKKITKYLGKTPVQGAAKLINPRQAAEMAKGKSLEQFAEALGVDTAIAGKGTFGTAPEVTRKAFAGAMEARQISAAGLYGDDLKELGRGMIYIDPKRRAENIKEIASITKGMDEKAVAAGIGEAGQKTAVYHEYLEIATKKRFGTVDLMFNKLAGSEHNAGQVILGEAGFVRAMGDKNLERYYGALRNTGIEKKTFAAGLEAFSEAADPRLKSLVTDFEFKKRVDRTVATGMSTRSSTALRQSAEGLQVAQKQIWENARSGQRHTRPTGSHVAHPNKKLTGGL